MYKQVKQKEQSYKAPIGNRKHEPLTAPRQLI